MSYTYTDYHHRQFDRQFSLPLPMPSPTSCWYPQRQDMQFGYSYPDPVTQDLEPNLSVAALASQLERLTADVEQLMSRMEAKRPPPAPAVLHHVPPLEPAPPYELSLFGSRETLPLGQQHYTDQEMSIPSRTPQSNDPYSHFQPSEELYPPVYNGEGYLSNSTIAGSMLPQPISHPLQLMDCTSLPQFVGSETLGNRRTFHAGYHHEQQLYSRQTSDAVASPLHEPDRRMGVFAEMESHLAITDRHVDSLRPPDLPEPEPPNPLQRSPSCWNPTSHCCSVVPLPAAAAVLRSPDIVGDEDELLDDDRPPTMMTLSCSPNIRYDSMELIVDDDSDESVKSCSNNAIVRLPNRDQVGIEEVLLDHEETNGIPIASSRGMTFQELCFQARREVLECILVGPDVCRTFYCYGISPLSTSRVSAEQRSCTFDPGGNISQQYACDWKKIEAFVGWKTATIQMCYHPQKYVLKVQKSGIHEHLLPSWQKMKAYHPYPQKASKIARLAAAAVRQPPQLHSSSSWVDMPQQNVHDSVPTFTALTISPTTTTQDRSCHGPPDVVGQPLLLHPTSPSCSAVMPSAAAAVQVLLKEARYLSGAKVGVIVASPQKEVREAKSMVNLSEVFANVVIYRVGLGINYDDGEEFQRITNELGVLLGNFDVGECVPWLCLIMFGMRGKVTGVARNIESLEFVVREHIGERHEGKKDFVDVLLELPRNERCGFVLGDIYIKALTLDMFVARSDKTFTVIEWTMSELIQHKIAKNEFFFMVDVLTLFQLRASTEHMHAIDPVDGGCSTEKTSANDPPPWNPSLIAQIRYTIVSVVDERQMPNLPYLQAVVEESLRLHPPGPLLLPRKAGSDQVVNGYLIPKGTQVLINVWAMGRDESIWKNANKFEPERFLDQKTDFKGQDYELIPFGSGRRVCPGLPLASRMLHMVTATLVHNFEWKLERPDASDAERQGVLFGLVVRRAEPLGIIPFNKQ